MIKTRTTREADADLKRKYKSDPLNGNKSLLTLVFNSNLPFGVSIMSDGGRKGYSAGRRMRK